MKRQFYLDDVERDLLRCSLELMDRRLTDDVETSLRPKDALYHARAFTKRRIAALLERLAEPASE